MVYFSQALAGMHTFLCNKCLRRCLSTTSPLYKKAKIQKQPMASYDAVTKPGDKKDVTLPLPKSYSSRFTEAAWYDWWVKQGYFKPTDAKDKFVMILPPPNVTGKLHIGHAFTSAIQDALVRWNRMRGLSTLWIPGLDHAGIATQVVVEKKLWREERLTRHDIGKEAFVKLIWQWKLDRAEEITSQLKRLGLSLDWSRAIFTMDDKIKEAVTTAFCDLHNQGLITRKTRLVNWSCQLKSAIADIEVDVKEIDGPTPFDVPGYKHKITLGYLTSFAYPIYDSENSEEIVVATTRLETLLGDMAIAVHPDDERYQHLIGRRAIHPFSDRLLPVIADTFVQRNTGTGAVKITPSHSQIDHDVAERHSLPHLNILNDDGTLCNSGEHFDGMKRFDAREKVAQLLQKKQLWRGQVAHPMAVPVCSRSYDIVEPRRKEQWFLDCSEMASEAIKAAEEKDLAFVPAYYSKLWAHHLEKTKSIPWCLSRQLWWGHSIPAYRLLDLTKKGEFVTWIVAPTHSEAGERARGILGHDQFKLRQDEDVLDTWFSSALLPFASLGWPHQNFDLSAFYPGSMIESGSDILFFWIARMVMMGKRLTGHLPFQTVLIHSLLLSQGEKMSKSKGNVIDPLSIIEGCTLAELEKSLETGNMDRKDRLEALDEQRQQFSQGIPECGADALRMALCSYNFKGQAINIQVQAFIDSRSLCNKIWQIYLFYNKHLGANFVTSDISQLKQLGKADEWILDRCARMVEVTANCFPTADLDVITEKLKEFWMNDFSKLYMEWSKPKLFAGTAAERHKSLTVAVAVMDAALRCLSPLMPFLSEELYQRLPILHKSSSISIAPFPELQQWMPYKSDELSINFEEMLAIARHINSFKQMFSLNHQSKAVGSVYVVNDVTKPIPEDVLKYMQSYCRLEHLHIDTWPPTTENACELEQDEARATVFIDVNESLKGHAAEEFDKMGAKLRRLLVCERELLDKSLQMEMTELSQEQLTRHLSKVERMKKEVARVEMCVNYLINVSEAPPNDDVH
ncbi:valine--tRNA ligase-like [Watersipora subatra]|uniref:valine--tRNA ligase-like n=1 Tax=Watersipora subatra TaxID=2589382 RepID=UPI00355C196A